MRKKTRATGAESNQEDERRHPKQPKCRAGWDVRVLAAAFILITTHGSFLDRRNRIFRIQFAPPLQVSNLVNSVSHAFGTNMKWAAHFHESCSRERASCFATFTACS